MAKQKWIQYSYEKQQAHIYRIDYYDTKNRTQWVPYELFYRWVEEKEVVIDIDSTLLTGRFKKNVTPIVEKLIDNIKKYALKYKIVRRKKEAPEKGIARLFQRGKEQVSHRITFHIPHDKWSKELYEDLLKGSSYRMLILKPDVDVDELLELFYSGMADDKDYLTFSTLHVYCNEIIRHMLVTTTDIEDSKMQEIIEEVRGTVKG